MRTILVERMVTAAADLEVHAAARGWSLRASFRNGLESLELRTMHFPAAIPTSFLVTRRMVTPAGFAHWLRPSLGSVWWPGVGAATNCLGRERTFLPIRRDRVQITAASLLVLKSSGILVCIFFAYELPPAWLHVMYLPLGYPTKQAVGFAVSIRTMLCQAWGLSWLFQELPGRALVCLGCETSPLAADLSS